LSAEDYVTNDYPDEPVLEDGEIDEYGEGTSDEDSYSSDGSLVGRRKPWQPIKCPGDEEYDLDLDSDDDGGPRMVEMVRDVWDLD
jgi:hypothetical protein